MVFYRIKVGDEALLCDHIANVIVLTIAEKWLRKVDRMSSLREFLYRH